MDEAVAALRDFNRFYTRFVGALDAHYLGSDLSLAEARLLYEIATRVSPIASELQADLGLDAGYVSRILRRFHAKGWISRERGKDARQRPILITSEGRARFEALDTVIRRQLAERLEPLRAADREMLVEALGAARALLGGGSASWAIRTFRAGDLAMIAARQSILYESYGWGRPMEILQAEVTTAFLRDFKPGREQCWVAERAGMMAGSVLIVDAGGGVGQLRLLYVEPWARGLGIGAALVDECVAFARGAGYERISLWTHTVLESARRIYAAAGFRIVATEIHDEFGRPEQGETWELALTR
ncbi:helix-turn-helix domain-containing GNAT family N-acetyltransferase [Sphingosinicella sp. CPCC 101087]|uniref:bifunctional helix-turn-helix transcriptional regulator/GNAT family N-acetyltransferase n=1 Tax=Sphingosinicella sp. CPCC 101087 TaxID=2497754 RepID=UPI00101C22C1|nr:helix-turn-helix domain-containing GNAT family N-acetyltransferase [Sphingosinicella sp. CPCC 101087]